MSGLCSPAGRARLAAARTGKCGPSLIDLPGPPQGPAEEGASASGSVKGGAKQSTLRPPQTRSRLVRSRASMAG